ncbi:MAG: helix-hairpin-helix domain-containing protein, partial [Tissierellia bacterium]|nr:helix-hairpin-helix domain-containing protein [Tissierellia bacterium]
EEVALPIEMETNIQESGKININLASSSELQSLPGIGEVIAGRIVEYRKTTKFKSIEDILDVSGIGEAKFKSIKDLISIN